MASPTDTNDFDGPGIPLQFSEPISWKLGRPPIAINTLSKRLERLLADLCNLKQDTVDRRSLSTAARDLCAPALLQHKDKAVKVYVACGLVEMLRLHAPDAPYTAGQLRDIFDLFVKQLRYLSSPDSPYKTQYIHLLESLSITNSVVLMADIPNGDALILQLFTYFFDIGAKPGIAKQIVYHMNDILVQLVADGNSLPSEVVDIIVAQFLRANPTAATTTTMGGRKEKSIGEGGVGGGGKQTSIREHMAPPPPAYNMARVICTSISCVDKMARHISQYFSEVIFDASPSSRPSHHHHHRKSSLSPDPHSSPDPAGPHEPTDDDLKELSKAHLLVKELWRAAPIVLQNVIPQLEQELLAENVQLRLLATETIGEMSATSPSPPLNSAITGGAAVVGNWSGSFASTCPASWRLWLGRVNDKSWLVRSKWVECATRVLQTLSPNTAAGQNAAQALIPLIADKLNDTDERVRLATCRSIGEDLDYASVKLKLNKSNGGEKLLENLALRAKDKKHSVRVEGMRVLARMWDEGYEDIRKGEEAVVKLLGWIPGRLLETSYVNDKDVNVLLDRVMWEVLLPLEYPPGCLESGKKKTVAANGKGKSVAKTKGKGKEKETAKKSTSVTTRTLREKKPQTKQKDTLDFSDSDEDLSDPPESGEDERGESDEESESEQEAEIDENQQPLASKNSAILTHDHNRTIRLLHLAHNLSPRSLRALLALASRQLSYSVVLNPFLDAAGSFGTTFHALSTTTTGDSLPPPSQADNKTRLTKLIDWLASQFPDPTRSREHLWKWVKLGDRRGWSLVRGMLSVDAGWIQVVANLKEVVKRIEKSPGGGGGILETVLPLLYRSALLLWNKSHVPTIVAMSKEAAAGAGQKSPDQDLLGGGAVDHGLAITANLLLKEMSSHIPAVFKAHIASLCTIIQECAPPIPGTKKATSVALEKLVPIDPSIVDTLSALSTFAKKYPQDVPRERKLHQALFALATSPLSTPNAAKHAVRVLMSAAMDRKEMYASDLVQRCITEWTYGGEGFIVRLGAMAEMVLVAPQAVMGEKSITSRIKQICVKECLTKVREFGGGRSDPEWESESLLNDEGKAKILAVKTLVNMLRANPSSADLTKSIMETLLKRILIEKGEISPSPNTAPTPKSHRAHLRLVAANLILKVAAQSGRLDELVSPELFNIVALTAQDSRAHVRLRFLGRLKKLLAAGRLGARWYAIVFLVAHDPEVREETSVWIRARAKAIASASASASTSAGAGKKLVASANIMELVLARLISLLAHHPDFPADPKVSSDELLDMAKYLAYYIRAVVTAENIGVVWYIAGYIKRVEDGIDAGESERLYILSELTQALCRRWKEMNEGWVIETWPGKIALPSGLYKKFDGGEGTEEEKKQRVDKKTKEISMRVYLPEEADGKVLDGLLREKKGRGEKVLANGDAGQAHGKKRKSDGGAGAVAGSMKKRRQVKGGVLEEEEDREGGGEGKKSAGRKGKTPRKKRASLGESEGAGATPKTPKRTPKRRWKSGGGDDDDDDARDADADDAGMSTVERRRSGRVVSKVVYAENEEEEGTGEELEKDDSDGGSGEESGDGSGEDEDAEDGDAEQMDIDDPDPDPEPEPKSRANTRGGDAKQRGKIIPKTATKRSQNTAPNPRTRGSKKRENGDRDGDEPMSDVSELTQFESVREVAQDNEAEESETERDRDVDRDDTGKETLEEALSKATPKAKTKTKTTPVRGRGRVVVGGSVSNKSSSFSSSEVKMTEVEAQKSPVKQMVVGRVTRRGAAAGR